MAEQDRFEEWMLLRIKGLNGALAIQLERKRYDAVAILDLRIRTMTEVLSDYRRMRSWEKDDG